MAVIVARTWEIMSVWHSHIAPYICSYHCGNVLLIRVDLVNFVSTRSGHFASRISWVQFDTKRKFGQFASLFVDLIRWVCKIKITEDIISIRSWRELIRCGFFISGTCTEQRSLFSSLTNLRRVSFGANMLFIIFLPKNFFLRSHSLFIHNFEGRNLVLRNPVVSSGAWHSVVDVGL